MRTIFHVPSSLFRLPFARAMKNAAPTETLRIRPGHERDAAPLTRPESGQPPAGAIAPRRFMGVESPRRGPEKRSRNAAPGRRGLYPAGSVRTPAMRGQKPRLPGAISKYEGVIRKGLAHDKN